MRDLPLASPVPRQVDGKSCACNDLGRTPIKAVRNVVYIYSGPSTQCCSGRSAMTRASLAILLAAICFLGTYQTGHVGEKKPEPGKKAAEAKNDFGFTAAFLAEIEKVGQISPDEFARRFPGKAEYLPKLTWDPTTAKYWDRLNLDPTHPRGG